jgi:1-deoxy-D-xylulose-5-phosphate synthase
LRLLDDSELARLADEIRELIITTTSTVGGHLASSLGAVELAIAIHRALDSPRDRIIWDVGLMPTRSSRAGATSSERCASSAA